ncbi:MAG: transcriptional regulator [Bacteroidetes bacterium B1(2017)]|nr:MAG: transcriptional regulator [Bacteroidetes bacterium B1(2017)]
MKFGETIRQKRLDNKLLLKHVAETLELDAAHLSRIENNERKANRSQVVKIANLLKIEQEYLITIWLADKLCNVVKDDQTAEAALKLALKSIREK